MRPALRSADPYLLRAAQCRDRDAHGRWRSAGKLGAGTGVFPGGPIWNARRARATMVWLHRRSRASDDPNPTRLLETPKPEALHPKPETRNPKPWTRTRNPDLCRSPPPPSRRARAQSLGLLHFHKGVSHVNPPSPCPISGWPCPMSYFVLAVPHVLSLVGRQQCRPTPPPPDRARPAPIFVRRSQVLAFLVSAGYRLMFLTARPITRSEATRRYLAQVRAPRPRRPSQHRTDMMQHPPRFRMDKSPQTRLSLFFRGPRACRSDRRRACRSRRARS
jgi:hypothetical protein